MKINACSHVPRHVPDRPEQPVCEECVKTGDGWVHLRMCLHCGHVGCCDNSRNRHAAKHFTDTGHAVMESVEPFEDWRWCHIDKVMVE